MTLLLLLKPHYRTVPGGWIPPRAKKGARKKKVYKVIEKGNTVEAEPVDFSKFAESLYMETKRRTVQKRKKKTIEILTMLKNLGEI